MTDRKMVYLDDAIATFEGWGLRHPSGMPAVTPVVKVKPPYDFDRYINGIKMAEGVTIERQTDIASACREAARIASKGPNGEAPVLVLAALEPAPADPLGAEWMRREAIRAAVWEVPKYSISLIPAPTEADLDAAALERPKVKALVEAVREIIVDDTWGLDHKTYVKCRTALAALRQIGGDA